MIFSLYHGSPPEKISRTAKREIIAYPGFKYPLTRHEILSIYFPSVLPTGKQISRTCDYWHPNWKTKTHVVWIYGFPTKKKFPHSANLQSPAFLGLHTEKILLQDANMRSSASSGTLLEKRNSARHGYMTIYFPSLTQKEKNLLRGANVLSSVSSGSPPEETSHIAWTSDHRLPPPHLNKEDWKGHLCSTDLNLNLNSLYR